MIILHPHNESGCACFNFYYASMYYFRGNFGSDSEQCTRVQTFRCTLPPARHHAFADIHDSLLNDAI